MVLVNMADMAPAHAANVVLTAANAATSPRLALLIFNAEPGLNPYQPNHKQKVPRNYASKTGYKEGGIMNTCQRTVASTYHKDYDNNSHFVPVAKHYGEGIHEVPTTNCPRCHGIVRYVGLK